MATGAYVLYTREFTGGQIGVFVDRSRNYLDKADEEIGRATSELQSHSDLVCRLLLEKKKKNTIKKQKKTQKKQTKIPPCAPIDRSRSERYI